MRKRPIHTLAATAAVLLACAAPAAAHVTIDPGEAPADGYATLQLQVPHGCGDSPTRVVRVQIPEQVPSVTPQVHPGWEVTTKEGPKDAVELHGETVSRGIKEIAWTATEADPLPADRLDLFGMSVKLPAGKAGDPVYFPTVQECVEGRESWIQIPRGGESGDELELPAPSVTLTAAAGGHGAAATGDDEDGAAADGVAAATAGDDGPSTGLVIAALVLGGLGLLVGLVALIGGRRRSAR
jgi:periplasmic copper chaperone A